jgi:hypothetical protein
MDILQAVNLKECEVVGDSRRWYWWGYKDGEYQNIYFKTEMPNSWEDAIREVEERFPGSTFTHHGHDRNDNYGKGDNEIPNGAFENKSYLTHFCFPEYITKIEGYAFCGTLLSGALIIPDDVTEIGSNAFNSTNISSLKLPSNLKVLGDSAFNGCKSLSGELSLPETLESIGSCCFYRCSMLSGTLTLPHKLKEIPYSCFCGCNGLTGDLVIPENITKIENDAFFDCRNMTGTLTLPNGLQEIGVQAF